jgi:branched-chain amino acid transport system substrate-binding protein
VGTEEKANFQSLLLQMKVLKPDMVYFGGIYDQAGVLLKQMREKGITSGFMGPDGFDSAEFVKIAQDAAKGAYFTTVAGPVENYPAAAAFSKAFEAKFKRKPESFAPYAYDSTQVILEAIKRLVQAAPGKKPTRDQICAEVRKTKLDGITGAIEFDAKGDRRKADYFVVSLKDGTYPGTAVKVISASPPTN